MLLVGGAGGAAYYLGRTAAEAGANRATFAVAHGPLVVSVAESGTIQSAQQEIIKSEIEGTTTLLTLIPEGQRVQKGDLLARLDVSQFQDEKIDREIAVQNADANSLRAKENLAVVQNQAKADVAQADLDSKFAVQDLIKYEEGDYPKQLKEAQNKITIAEEEAQRAAEKYNGSLQLSKQDFVSGTELKADELAKNKSDLDLQLAQAELSLLQKFDHDRQVTELRSNVEQKSLALERAQRKASSDVVQAEVDLRAKDSELRRQKDKLQRTLDQISHAEIRAPRAGLVVYATSAKSGGWRGDQQPLAEGQQVRERQELIYLPTATDMLADIKIHESSLEKVRLGMPVRVTVDALPGKTYWGTVDKIAPLPDAGSMWMNPDLKLFPTQVKITGNGEEMRTGMSCRAEVIVENFDEATYVPVQSVVRVNGQPTAFVALADGKTEQRPVEVGLDNNQMVVIQSGLKPGEQVLLTPPLEGTGSVTTLKAGDIPQDQKDKVADAKDNPSGKDAAAKGPAAGAQQGAQQGGNAAMGKAFGELRSQGERGRDDQAPRPRPGRRQVGGNEVRRGTHEEVRHQDAVKRRPRRPPAGGRPVSESAVAEPTQELADPPVLVADDPVVELYDVHKTYFMGGQQVRALDGLSLQIGRGDFVALMGPSGSGKSTMLNVLGTLDRPTSGTYLLGGRDVVEMDDDDLSDFRLRTLGFIFQSFNLIPQLTVRENIELPLYYLDRDPQEMAERATELATRVGLGDRIGHRPTELSGGQQQRVAIARSLANDPPLILADEPTGNLDSHTSDQIMKLLIELNAAGKTIIMVTHEPDIAEYAKKRIHMRDGRVEKVD